METSLFQRADSMGNAQGLNEPSSPEILTVANVHRAIHGRVVLRDVSFGVARGTVTVILGRSGSGKTTLLRTINHLDPVSRGEILLNGQSVGYKRTGRGLVPMRRHLARERANARIAMVFQAFNLFEHMTVLENIIEAPVRVHGEERGLAVGHGRDLLRWAGLAEYEDYYPHQLSGGQQQRVAIVRALATRPVLMLFDEPTSARDPELVGDVLQMIRRLAAAGMTMIVVTHELAFARDCADQIVFMDDGVIKESGSPSAVLDHSRDPATRHFLRVVGAGAQENELVTVTKEAGNE